MRIASVADVRARLSAYLKASAAGPVVVTRNGKPVAVLLAVQNQSEAEQLAQVHARSLQSIFEEAHEQLEQGAGIPHDQFWREVEQARRAKREASGRGK